MSASNWTVCPRCAAEHEAAIDRAASVAEDAYGKVPIEEFDRLRAIVESLQGTSLPQDFREDYEFFGAETGTVTADYGGQCNRCGLEARLKQSVTFFPEPKP